MESISLDGNVRFVSIASNIKFPSTVRKPPGTPCPVQSAAMAIAISPKVLNQQKSPPTISLGRLKIAWFPKKDAISSSLGCRAFWMYLA